MSNDELELTVQLTLAHAKQMDRIEKHLEMAQKLLWPLQVTLQDQLRQLRKKLEEEMQIRAEFRALSQKGENHEPLTEPGRPDHAGHG